MSASRRAGDLASDRSAATRSGVLIKVREPPRVSPLMLLVGMLVLLIATAHFVVQPEFAAAFALPAVRLTLLFVVLAAAGVFAVACLRLLDAEAVRWLTSGVGVLIAFALGLVETSLPQYTIAGVSSVVPWILFIAIVVPHDDRSTLVIGLLAALTWPLAYAINSDARGLSPVPWHRVIVWPGINVLTAVLASLLRRHLDGPDHHGPSSSSLGSYRLISPIGEGGMGEVWKASHEMLARRAAIKLVRPNAGSFTRQPSVWVERFRREANVIASLQSPHTIYLYDFGLSGDGQFYYVMELVDGISLQTLITTFGPQPASRVSAILTQICASLEEAHERGVIHRDLKPSNVMICQLALRHDFVKVLDFGLAKCAACEDIQPLTVEGTTAGTPGYIAPEVALGEFGVDARADIYALGCVAYFLLTGTLVFPDNNPMSMALKHVQATPDPPSARTELPIPAELEQLVLRCLEKRPADRPANVREIAGVLARIDLPVWSEDDAAAWWKLHLPRSSSLRIAWDEAQAV